MKRASDAERSGDTTVNCGRVSPRASGFSGLGPLAKIGLGCGVAVAFYGLFELMLLCIGIVPLHERSDPFVGFAGYTPLFVPRTSPGAEPIMETAPNKLSWFNRQSFPAHKAKGVMRVFCLGGSTTYGYPYEDPTSFPGWLRAYLPTIDPSRRWEIINAGGVGYASYRECRLMEEFAEYEPDLFVIYTGHNEFLEQRTYDKLLQTPKFVRDVAAVASRTRVYSVLHDVAYRGKPSSAAGGAVLGTEVNAVLDRSVGPDYYHRDDRMHEAVIDHYRVSLVRMTEISARVGAKIIFVTPASNLGDFSPFKTEPSPGLTPAALDEVKKLKASAFVALDAGQHSQVAALAQRGLALDARDAELLYLRGRGLRGLSQFEEARAALLAARDEDVCPLRALTSMCDIVADVARKTNAGFVDFVRLMNERARDGIPDSAWFLDHVHPTIEGNRELALALIDEMRHRGIVSPQRTVDDAALAAIGEKVKANLDAKAHASALKKVGKVLVWAGKRREAERFIDLALQTIPENSEGHLIKGTIRQLDGDKNGALRQFRDAVRFAPTDAQARRCLGMTLFELGRLAEARLEIEEAVRLNPKLVEAQLGLGSVLQGLGDKKAAEAAFRTVLQLEPAHAEAHTNLGSLLVEAGNIEEATLHYRRAIESKAGAKDASLVEAYVNLANLCLHQGNGDDALALFQKALDLAPGSAEAHSGRGDALLQKGDLEDAVAEYGKVVELKPDSADAHANLGSAFLQKGDLDRAIAHYRRALELKSDFLEVQNNLAWVLATSSEPAFRNGHRAVDLAERANRQTGGTNPLILHTLAAAYAEAGRFDEATSRAKHAMELAQSAEQPDLVHQLRTELKLYEAKRPFHNDVQ